MTRLCDREMTISKQAYRQMLQKDDRVAVYCSMLEYPIHSACCLVSHAVDFIGQVNSGKRQDLDAQSLGTCAVSFFFKIVLRHI